MNDDQFARHLQHASIVSDIQSTDQARLEMPVTVHPNVICCIGPAQIAHIVGQELSRQSRRKTFSRSRFRNAFRAKSTYAEYGILLANGMVMS
jgi:hypothetical protein